MDTQPREREGDGDEKPNEKMAKGAELLKLFDKLPVVFYIMF